jgi:hypothetical protein
MPIQSVPRTALVRPAKALRTPGAIFFLGLSDTQGRTAATARSIALPLCVCIFLAFPRSDCISARLPPRPDAIVEASRRKNWRRTTKPRRCRPVGRALRLGTRLLLRRWRHFHRGLFRFGCHRFRLRRGWLDRRQIVRHRGHVIVRHRGLILAVRSEQIEHEPADAA